MKNITFMIIAALALQACEPKQSPAITVIDNGSPDAQTTPTVPADPVAPAPEAAKVAAPVAAAPVNATVVTKPKFCIPHELRTDYSTAIPSSGSALYTALIHDGVGGRLADPMCLAAYNVVSSGRTYVACAIHADGAFEGNIYTRKWADADRVWVKGAIERQVFLANATSAEISMTIGTVDSASVFYSNVAWRGQALVVISIDTAAVDFSGYCQ